MKIVKGYKMKKLVITFLIMVFSIVSYAGEKIVYIGYGSLIGNFGKLPISNQGFVSGGPELAVDFLRISGLTLQGTSYKFPHALNHGADFPNIRLSITIVPKDLVSDKTRRSTTLYADVNSGVDFDTARQALADREGTKNIENIAYIKNKDGKISFSSKVQQNMSEEDIKSITSWMDGHGVSTVLFAYFDANFNKEMQEYADEYTAEILPKDFADWKVENVQLFYNILYYNDYIALGTSMQYITTVDQAILDNSIFWEESSKLSYGGLYDYIYGLYIKAPSKEYTDINNNGK